MITKTIFLRIAKLRMTKYHSGYSAPLSTTERWRYWLGAKFILFCFETVAKSKQLLYVYIYMYQIISFCVHILINSIMFVLLKYIFLTSFWNFNWIRTVFGLKISAKDEYEYHYSNTIRIPNYSLTSESAAHSIYWLLVQVLSKKYNE